MCGLLPDLALWCMTVAVTWCDCEWDSCLAWLFGTQLQHVSSVSRTLFQPGCVMHSWGMGVEGTQWVASTEPSRLERGFHNSMEDQRSMRLQKCHLSVLLRVPTISCLSGSSFNINTCDSFAYGPDTSQTCAFVLGPRVSNSTHKLFKCGFSIPGSSMVFLNVIFGFQSQRTHFKDTSLLFRI